MRRALAAVSALLVGGCDLVVGLDERTRAARCPHAGVADGFDQAPACAPWGRVTESNATATIVDGTLAMTFGAGSVATGGCTSFLATVVGPDGASVAIREASAAPTAFIQLALVPEDQTSAAATVQARRGMVQLVETGVGAVASLPVEASRIRGLRLRPDGGGVVGEVSTDGDGWTPIGTVAGTPPVTAFIAVHAGTSMAEPAASVTAFDELRFCAP